MLKPSIKKAVSLTLAALMAIPMIACGKKDEAVSSDPTQEGVVSEEDNSPYTYVAEMLNLNAQNLYNCIVKDGSLYLSDYTYDEATSEYNDFFLKYSLDTLEKEFSTPLDASLIPDYVAPDSDMIFSNLSVSSFTVTDAKDCYLLMSDYRYDQTTESTDYTYYLVALDSEGNHVSTVKLGNEKDFSPSQSSDSDYFSGMYYSAVDNAGNAILAYNSSIVVISSQGELLAKLDLPDDCSWISSLNNIAGTVYLSYSNYTNDIVNTVFVPITIDGTTVSYGKDTISGFTTDYSVVAINEKELLYRGSDGAYIFNTETKENTLIFKWNTIDINGDFVSFLAPNGENNYLIGVSDWNTNETYLASVTRKLKTEVASKTELVIASFYDDSNLSSAVVNFNRSQSEYHITVKSYFNWETDTDYDAALTRMNNDLTGSNPPDMVLLDGVSDIESLANKGIFVDLSTYMSSSSQFKKSDFYDNILEACTYNGTLVSIPRTFYIYTPIGSAAELGKNEGWTVSELIDYANAHPEASLLDYSTRESILRSLMLLSYSEFVDSAAGTCNFASEDFIKILEYVAKYPEEYTYSEYDDSTPIRIGKGEILLAEAYLSDYQELQLYGAVFKDGYVAKGYPTADGSAGHIMSPSGSIAILSNSSAPDVAYKFIEFFLAQEDAYSYYFYSLKDKNQKIAEEQLKNAGESSGAMVMYDADWSYEYHYATKEEVDAINNIIETAKLGATMDANITQIIEEESQAYFQGQKTSKEVADIIQSRISVYIAENY